MGALTGNVGGSKGIDATEIVWSARAQLALFFAACLLLGLGVVF